MTDMRNRGKPNKLGTKATYGERKRKQRLYGCEVKHGAGSPKCDKYRKGNSNSTKKKK